ncbi:Top3a, partial [Symbiodinium pilosum]
RGPQHLNYWALAESGLLNSGGIFYRTRPATAISHNKFIIRTSPDGTTAVWTGSTNITAGAIFGHSNVGHILSQHDICQKYRAYWEKLLEDPDKKDFAKFNEELSPLPEENNWSELVLFSPRLRWADALSFMAQLILRARHSVAFTAAFGISREISPALLAAGSEGAGAAVPTYLLLESQGNWQASRDAVQALQRKANVRIAFGMHLEVPPIKSQPNSGAWIPETLTGLNEHVRYVHTKILLVDMFSDSPIVVSGSGNFSRAAMESNDENVVVVRGDRNLSDAYSVEFFRIFEHMRFRNEVQGVGKRSEVDTTADPQADLVMCRCGQAVAERTVKKAGPNVGRRFRCCANPQGLSCGYFAWVESAEAKEVSREEEEPWPWCYYSKKTFATLERRLFEDLHGEHGVRRSEQGRSEAEEPALLETQGGSCSSFESADEGMLDLWDLCGVSEDPAEPNTEPDSQLRQPARPNLTEIRDAATEMLGVNLKVKGGSKRLRELRDHLVTC